jgi:hypothetical protein
MIRNFAYLGFIFSSWLLLISCQNKKVYPQSNLDEAQGPVTFKKNIEVILLDKCLPCHGPKGDRASKYVEYNTAKTLVTGIIGRTSLPDGDPLKMPQNRPGLSKAQIELIRQWVKDGLLEK